MNLNLKPIKYYLFVVIAILVGYSYSVWSGFAFYNDKVEKNTEYNGNRSRGGYVNRFYHK
jgi:hypothetical protein